jgi:hypothetical protein
MAPKAKAKEGTSHTANGNEEEKPKSVKPRCSPDLEARLITVIAAETEAFLRKAKEAAAAEAQTEAGAKAEETE